MRKAGSFTTAYRAVGGLGMWTDTAHGMEEFQEVCCCFWSERLFLEVSYCCLLLRAARPKQDMHARDVVLHKRISESSRAVWTGSRGMHSRAMLYVRRRVEQWNPGAVRRGESDCFLLESWT